jgi:hypothetical protein
MKKPNQEKKNTLPYWLTGFSTGMDLAFLLMGLMVGADQSTEGENMAGRWSFELFVRSGYTSWSGAVSHGYLHLRGSCSVYIDAIFLSPHLATCHDQKQRFAAAQTEMLKSMVSQGIWAF